MDGRAEVKFAKLVKFARFVKFVNFAVLSKLAIGFL